VGRKGVGRLLALDSGGRRTVAQPLGRICTAIAVDSGVKGMVGIIDSLNQKWFSTRTTQIAMNGLGSNSYDCCSYLLSGLDWLAAGLGTAPIL